MSLSDKLVELNFSKQMENIQAAFMAQKRILHVQAHLIQTRGNSEKPADITWITNHKTLTHFTPGSNYVPFPKEIPPSVVLSLTDAIRDYNDLGWAPCFNLEGKPDAINQFGGKYFYFIYLQPLLNPIKDKAFLLWRLPLTVRDNQRKLVGELNDPIVSYKDLMTYIECLVPPFPQPYPGLG